MYITEIYDIVYVRLMLLRLNRITKKNDQVNLVMLDLSTQLLFAAKMACQEFMN